MEPKAPLTPKQRAEGLVKVYKVMRKNGIEKAERISRIAKKLHPNAVAIFPMYRSTLVLLPSGKLIGYNDPAWMGYPVNARTLRRHRIEWQARGGRDQVSIYLTRPHQDGRERPAYKQCPECSAVWTPMKLPALGPIKATILCSVCLWKPGRKAEGWKWGETKLVEGK